MLLFGSVKVDGHNGSCKSASLFLKVEDTPEDMVVGTVTLLHTALCGVSMFSRTYMGDSKLPKGVSVNVCDCLSTCGPVVDW